MAKEQIQINESPFAHEQKADQIQNEQIIFHQLKMISHNQPQNRIQKIEQPLGVNFNW